MESMIVKTDVLTEYRGYLRSFAACILEIWAQSTAFSQVRYWAHFHRSCQIAPIAMMEILGLDPYQSQTQYLQAKIGVRTKWKQSGNAVVASLPQRIRFVSTSSCSKKKSGDKADTLLLLCSLDPITYLKGGQ
jgi:hypothetical protein